MRHPLSALAALCFTLAAVVLQAPMAQAVPAEPVASAAAQQTARVIVQYKTGSSAMRALSASEKTRGTLAIPRHASVLSARHGVAMTDGMPVGARTQVVFAKGMSSAKLAELLSKDSDVEFAEPDLPRRIRSVPNDPLFPGAQISTTPAAGQWYLRAPDSVNVSAINAQTAWNTTAGTSSVVVAVLDTGIRFEHPDLVGKTYPGYDFVTNVSVANDGNGRDADASDPGDWVTTAEVNDAASTFYHCTDPDSSGQYTGENSSWHGTQVAGIVGAATNNSIGMASVGRNVMILPVRVLGKCVGYDSDIQAGMRWAAGISVPGIPDNTHPAQVVNLSLGGAGSCGSAYQGVVNELLARGVVVVASAGNEGKAVDAPANCSGVIAVSGVRHAGTKVGYSSLGPEVAISAPAGNCVDTTGACVKPLLTTVNSGTTTPVTNTYSDGFNPSLGTSFSAPLVAGTVSLMLSVNPTLTASQVRSALQSSARAFPTTSSTTTNVCQAPSSTLQDECICTTSTCGAGLLDAAGAVAQAVSLRSTPMPTIPLSASSANATVGGTNVLLDGTGTQPSSGRTIATYAWSISGTGASFMEGSPTGPTATLVPTAAGTVVVTLTVTDNIGTSTSASTNIDISTGPTAVIVPSATTVTAGTAVTLDGSSSVALSGRTIVSYAWSVTSGNTLTNATSPTATLVPNAAGTATVTLTVTDSAGATSTSSADIAVTAAPSSSGGGALGIGWLAALMAAVLVLSHSRRRQQG